LHRLQILFNGHSVLLPRYFMSFHFGS
jgi:hypothetical protein